MVTIAVLGRPFDDVAQGRIRILVIKALAIKSFVVVEVLQACLGADPIRETSLIDGQGAEPVLSESGRVVLVAAALLALALVRRSLCWSLWVATAPSCVWRFLPTKFFLRY